MSNIRLFFGTDLFPDLNPRSVFHFTIIERYDVLDIKYELKGLQMNFYEMFWRGRPSDNERCRFGGGLNSMSAF